MNIEFSATRTVCISARKKGESGGPTAGWRYQLSGTKSDEEAINTALEAAKRYYGEEYEDFKFARTGVFGDNVVEVVDPAVRGGVRWERLFEFKPGRLW